MMNKKLITMIITGIIMVSIAGCGGSKTAAVNSGTGDVLQESGSGGTEKETTVPDQASVPDVTAVPDEAADEMLEKIAEDNAPGIDISGCDTFTQIIDKKLTPGMGYANLQIGGMDVFLVSSGTYDNLDGNIAATDAVIFAYGEDDIIEIGKVSTGGTAYPLALKDGILYAGSNHWGIKYGIRDNKLVILERSAVEYETDGSERYYFESEGVPTADAEKKFSGFYEELEKAEIINFQPVDGKTTAEVEGT